MIMAVGAGLAALLGCAAVARAQVSLFRPNLGVPAFALTNGTWNVEVEATTGLASNGWSGVLANDLRSWTCTVERVDYGNCVFDRTLPGYQLVLRAPPDAPPEVFQLVVGHSAAGADTNRHCVSILQEWDASFYILHYADPQAETTNATAANGAGGSHGSIQAIQWAAPVFSLIHPRFMLNTGDEVENGVATMYPKYIDAVEAIGAPLLITRGNNDAQGSLPNWKRDIGQPTYSLTLGSFYVIMKDYGANENYAEFTNDYASSFTNPAIAYRLFGQHYSSGGSVYSPPAGQYPHLMLVGHNHTFSTLSTTPYPILSSGPGWDYGAVGLFAFHPQGAGWACSNIAGYGAVNKIAVFGSWGAPRSVTNWFLVPNDGAAATNTTWVTNSLDYDFWDGRVRFLMRKSSTGYTVSGGDKLAEYDYAGGSNTAVLVKVNLRRNALTEVTVSPRYVDTTVPFLVLRWPATGGVLRTSASNVLIAGTAADEGGITALTYAVAGPAPACGEARTGTVALVAAGALWKYLDDGSDQGTAWRVPDFPSGWTWPEGAAEFGYGDGDEVTTNCYGMDPDNKYLTTYYRHAFDWAECRLITNPLALRVRRDDGVAVYLNQEEVFRNNLPEGELGYLTTASAAVSGAAESAWQSQTIPCAALSNGANTVAAEIHQSSAGSSDISFDLALDADLGSTWFLTNGSLPVGTSVVTVVARDAAGNASTARVSVVVTEDVDDDALRDDWEERYFGGTGAGPDDDADGDSMNNFAEYLAGTDPTNGASQFTVAGEQHPALIELSFFGLADRSYTVFFKTNLLQGADWQMLGGETNGSDETISVLDSVSAPQRYYRLRVRFLP